MNATCPQCGYPLHRDNHPHLSSVRFCRSRCIAAWAKRHGLSGWPTDVLPDGVDRRAA